MVLGVIVLWGRYPSGITHPYAIALAGMALVLVTLGLWALKDAPPGGSSTSSTGLVAAALGSASVVSFGILVLGNASITADHTLPTSARLVPVMLGSVAVLTGIAGLVGAHGSPRTIRTSTVAIIMGGVSAIVPLYLWMSACYLFEVDCR